MILNSVPVINCFITVLHCSTAVSHPFLSHYVIELHSPKLLAELQLGYTLGISGKCVKLFHDNNFLGVEERGENCCAASVV